MRKLFFSAMTCIVFLADSFASNELITKNEVLKNDIFLIANSNETRPCSCKGLFYDGDGNLFIKKSNTKQNVTKEGCVKLTRKWLEATLQIFPYFPGTFEIVWGDRL